VFKFSVRLLLLLSLAIAGCERPKSAKRASHPLGELESSPELAARSLNTAAASVPSNAALAADSLIEPKDRVVQASSSMVARPKRPTAQSLDELLLFFPAKYPDGEWEPKALNFSDVWFRTDDGVRIHGWYCPYDNPRAFVLYAHGNAGNLSHRAAVMRLLQSHLRASVLIFDYRGYGRSEGVPTVEGILNDSRAARTYLANQARINESDIILMGNSLGGAVAVQLAVENAPRALVLESTFSSLKEVASHHYPALAWLVPAKKLNSASQIARFQGPLLQSHGDADRTIPFALGSKLFGAANEPKHFVRIPNGDHNDWLPDEYYRQLDAFLDQLIVSR
jgi:fermentation-respiration switch protein FrsA (DUF1100 family)